MAGPCFPWLSLSSSVTRSWSNSTNSNACSCTAENRLCSRMRSKTLGLRSRRKYGRALAGCRLITWSSPMHSSSKGSSFVACSSPCTADMTVFRSYTSEGQVVTVFNKV